jgi:hypothetical protein
MSCTFIFVNGNLHGLGTTRKAAIRDAEKRTSDEAGPFDPRHHDVRIEEATYGAYLAAKVAHDGSTGAAEWNADLGKYALPRR